MKSFLILSLITVSLCMTSCQCGPQMGGTPYSYVQGPGGMQQVACMNNDGTQFLMDLVLFNMLMNHGGYGSVMNHYHSYPGRFTPYRGGAGWRSYNGPSYSPSSYSGFRRTGPAPTFRNTSPVVVKPTFRSNIPSSKPTFGSPSHSFGRPSSGGFKASGSRSFGGRRR